MGTAARRHFPTVSGAAPAARPLGGAPAAHDVGLLNLAPPTVWIAVVVTLLARSFLSFLTHLLMHKVPAFWRVHRVHHLDTELDVSTTVRFHPLESVVGSLIGVPFVVVLGLTPWVLVLYETLDVAIALWSHSNLRLPVSLNRTLHHFVVTPDLHRIHHSAWQPETDSNFWRGLSAMGPRVRDVSVVSP